MHIQQLLVDDRNESSIILFKQFSSYANRYYGSELWTWGREESDILAVNEYDLREELSIPWKRLNLVFAETCQQIYENLFKLDNTKAYIFITESWISKEELDEKFHGIPIIKHFCILNEILNYGKELFTPESHFGFLKDAAAEPEYDFFCLIGRYSSLRSRFITRLSQCDLSKSLVKLNGKVVKGSGASTIYDKLNYNQQFNASYYKFETGLTAYPKFIQTSLYHNFKFEVQFETDALGGQGWDVVEYHLTEKTIKPLLMSKPCLMYGPPGYLTWLASYGIDLGHGNFSREYDKVKNDGDRVDAIIAHLNSFESFSEVKPSAEQHQANMLGFFKLGKESQRNCVELYDLVERF